MKTAQIIKTTLIGAALLVALGVGALFWAFHRVGEAAAARKQADLAISQGNELMSELRDAETGQRGFALTGDEAFLEPYLAVRDNLRSHLAELRKLTRVEATEKQLDAMGPLMDAKLAELARVIELRRKQDMAAVIAAVSGGKGKRLMDSIRVEMKGFIQAEGDTLARREAQFQSDMQRLFAILAAASGFTLLLLLSFVRLLQRESQHQIESGIHRETQHLLEVQKATSQRLQQANASLQVSEERLAVTLHSIGDAVIATDAMGRVTLVNPLAEKLTGWTQAQAADRPVDEIFHIISQETRQPSAVPVRKTLAHGTIQGLANHTVLIARDGSECAIADSCAPIRDRDRRVVGAVLVFRDVTAEDTVRQALQAANVELEGAKTTAEKANLAKSEFLSNMSHELRSPLNAILGFAQLMESDHPVPAAPQMARIAQILQAGWHLLKLIDEILDLAAIESGKLSLSQESVSLSTVMTECQAMMEPQAQKRGIVMTFPHFDHPMFVRADLTRLKQIVINLVSNAIKYNRELGTVVVACAASAPGRIRISVTDTGEGLSAEKVAQLFQPFNRLGQEAGGVAGTGIGLMVTKRLAELMDGVLGVESTPGIGSVFWCELTAVAPPRLAFESGEAKVLAPLKSPTGGARQRTLLYVEDNPANMELVEQLVARCPDLRMMTAVDAAIGIELARATLPTVILMDINLPGISGIDALEILRRDPVTAHIPVVALSANAMPRDIAKGMEAGFFRYLTKPIKVKDFMETLAEALEEAVKGQKAGVWGQVSAGAEPRI